MKKNVEYLKYKLKVSLNTFMYNTFAISIKHFNVIN